MIRAQVQAADIEAENKRLASRLAALGRPKRRIVYRDSLTLGGRPVSVAVLAVGARLRIKVIDGRHVSSCLLDVATAASVAGCQPEIIDPQRQARPWAYRKLVERLSPHPTLLPEPDQLLSSEGPSSNGDEAAKSARAYMTREAPAAKGTAMELA